MFHRHQSVHLPQRVGRKHAPKPHWVHQKGTGHRVIWHQTPPRYQLEDFQRRENLGYSQQTSPEESKQLRLQL